MSEVKKLVANSLDHSRDKIYIATRVYEWETNCEIVWIKLQLAGSVPLHIAAYYKPSESDPQSVEVFKKSVAMANSLKGHIWMGSGQLGPKTSRPRTTRPIKKIGPRQLCQIIPISEDNGPNCRTTRPIKIRPDK